MKTIKYHNLDDVILSIPEDHYNASKIHYKGHTWFRQDLEDWLWDEFEYEKYGESYEEGACGDNFTKDIQIEFDNWIDTHSDKVYEWLNNALDAIR